MIVYDMNALLISIIPISYLSLYNKTLQQLIVGRVEVKLEIMVSNIDED